MVHAESWLPSESQGSDPSDERVRRYCVAAIAAHEYSSDINHFVVQDVVPHLVRSLGRPNSGEAADRHRFAEDMVREFTAAVLEIDDGPASRFVDRLRSDGVPVESIYLGLFSASARLLGEYWTTDRCPFTEVTLGLWRLHRLVRDMSHDFRNESVRGRRSLMALITTAPGEQHSFGVVMLSEWFRRAGWSLVPSPLRTNAEIARAVSRASLDVVGFSASSEASIDALSATIAAVRRTSRNRSVGVMVGGSLFNERPDLVVRVGADATACDAPEAIAKAERFAVCGDWAPY